MVTSFNNTKKFQRKYAKGRAQEAYRLAYLDQIGDEEEARDLGANFRISMDGVVIGLLGSLLFRERLGVLSYVAAAVACVAVII